MYHLRDRIMVGAFAACVVGFVVSIAFIYIKMHTMQERCDRMSGSYELVNGHHYCWSDDGRNLFRGY